MQSSLGGLKGKTGKDRSGIGSVIAKAAGSAAGTLGDVTQQLTRVVRKSGDNLHASAKSHEENEASTKKSFDDLHPDNKDKSGPGSKGPGGKGTGGDGPGKNGKGPDGKGQDGKNSGDNPVPHDDRNTKSDPVDVATGEVVLRQRDLELGGLLPLILERVHVSSYRAGTLFGRSWASTLDQRLEIGDAQVRYFGSDGLVLVFPVVAAGEVALPVSGPGRRLVREGGGYRLADPANGRELRFGLATGSTTVAPLRAIIDPCGSRIDIERDLSEIPVLVRHSGGYRVGVVTEDARITELRVLGGGDAAAGGEAVGGAAADVVVRRFGYDDAGRLVRVHGADGALTVFDYDREGRMSAWRDSNGTWFRYAYDLEGRCVRTSGMDGFLSSTFAYDRARRVTRYTDSLGNVTEFAFSPANKLIRETDPLGNTTSYGWDQRDRKVSETDPLGRTTRFTYDENGALVGVSYPDGTTTTATRNADGTLASVTQPDGVTLLESTGAQTVIADPLNQRFAPPEDQDPSLPGYRVLRNATGLPLSLTDASGATTSYEYDLLGRPVAVRGPEGELNRYGWTVDGDLAWRLDPDGGRQSWRYDGEGNCVQHTDPQGRVTRIEYAVMDVPVAEIAPDGSRIECRYDTERRLVSVTNATGLQWHYTYDAAGRMIASTDFDGRERSYRYDAAGQLVAEVNGAGETVENAYDEVGNLIERRAGENITRFRYDPLGRLLQATNADTDLVVHRDASGQVLAETVNGDTTTVERNQSGQIRRRMTPSGVRSTWTFDERGNPASLTVAGQTLSLRHDTSGREIERRGEGGFWLGQTFDPSARLTAQTILDSATPGHGRRREFRYRTGGELAGRYQQPGTDREYAFDHTGRVTDVHQPGGTEHYTYNTMDNIVHARWPATATPDRTTGDRRYHGTLLTQAGQVGYRYDAQGRRTSTTVDDNLTSGPDSGRDAWHYSWDTDDRLTGVTTPEGTRWCYRYDALGRRTAKQRLDATGTVAEQVQFRWLADVLVEQEHTAPDGTRHIVTWDHHPGDDRPITQIERLLPPGTPDEPDDTTGIHWYNVVTDNLGTPTELVDTTGTTIWHSDTTLWGLTSTADAAAMPLRFPGQYHDPETGLHYNFHRYYDPETGHYLSQDPLGLDPAPNPTAYVTNPLTWSDPLGLYPCGKDEHFWEKEGGKDPVAYMPHRNSSGGAGVRVRLGPGQAESHGNAGGSPAKNDKINNTDVEKMNKKHHLLHPFRKQAPWVKGHLWNEKIGGPALSPNLTAMTQHANGRYSDNVENPVKLALDKAAAHGRANTNDTNGHPYWYGVDFKATVHGQQDSGIGNTKVANHVNVESYYVRKHKLSGQVESMGDQKPPPDGGIPWPNLPNGSLNVKSGNWIPTSGSDSSLSSVPSNFSLMDTS